jgi:hypothetical protein
MGVLILLRMALSHTRSQHGMTIVLPFSAIRIARNPYVDIPSLFLGVASKAAITCNYNGLTYNKICLFFFFFLQRVRVAQ